jgi:hypothetical protein
VQPQWGGNLNPAIHEGTIVDQERELCFWDNKQLKNNFMTRVMGDQRRSATNPESWQLS